MKSETPINFFISFMLFLSIPLGRVQAQTSNTTQIATINALLVNSKNLGKESKWDSARLLLETALFQAEDLRIDTLQGKVLLHFGDLEQGLSNYQKADSLYVLSIPLLKDGSDDLIEVYFERGGIQFRKGSMDSISQHLDMARFHIGDDTMSQNMMRYLNSKAAVASQKKEYLAGIDYFFKTKRINEKYNNPVISSNINNGLAIVYHQLNAFDLALDIYHQQIEYGQKNNDLNMEMYTYYNIIDAYINQKKYDEAISIGKKAIELKDRTQKSTEFGMAYYNMGIAYLKKDQLDSASYYFNLGIDISKAQKEEYTLYSNYEGLSLVHFERGNYDLAKEYGEKSKNDYYVTANEKVNEVLATIFESEGDYQKANKLLRENYQAKIEDDRKNGDFKLIATLLKEKFEGDKKAEQQLLNQQIERQKYQLYGSLLIGGLAMISVIGFMLAYYALKKRNDLLKIDLENKKLIEQQAAELQKIDDLKSRLFANIAHELRTPLTLISNPLKHLLNAENGNSEIKMNRDTIKAILSNSEHLLTMSNQIQELSKEEVKELEVNINQFSLHNFIQYIASKFELLAKVKGITLAFPNLKQEDILLITDGKKLEIIISNLLSNAIKYTDTDGTINVSLQSTDNKIAWIIEDTGRGISKEDLPNIFDRFYQAKSDKIIPEGGIGIGLAICKEYAQLLNGDIQVTSELGKGSTFTCQFPQKITGEIKRTELLEFIPIPKYEFKTAETAIDTIETGDYILIVEDNVEMCAYLQKILEVEYDLMFAHNGKEALQQLKNKQPALVITDLMMPIMDGMELINIIKNDTRWDAIPLLILSAKNNVLDEMKALRVGVDDYLIKPFDDRELKTIIYNLLNFAEEQKAEKELAKDFLLDSDLPLSSDINLVEEKKWLLELEETISKMVTDYDLNVDKIATELSFTAKHLNRKLKLLTGFTTKKYINEIRLLMGRRMIKNKEHSSVKAVAFSVGFKSEKVFSRNFKARFGKSPSEYMG